MDRVKHILVKVGFPGSRLGAARRLVTLKFRQRVVARTVTQHKHSNHIFSKEIILPVRKKKKATSKSKKIYLSHIYTFQMRHQDSTNTENVCFHQLCQHNHRSTDTKTHTVRWWWSFFSSLVRIWGDLTNHFPLHFFLLLLFSGGDQLAYTNSTL